MVWFPAKEVQLARVQRQAKILDEIHSLLQTRLKEAEIAQAAEDASVRIVDPATVPRTPVAPRPALNTVLAGVAGLLLGVVAAFARERSDRSVHTRGDVQLATGLPVLGLIPTIGRQKTIGGSTKRRRRSSRRLLVGGKSPAPTSATDNGTDGSGRRATGAPTSIVELDRPTPLSEAYVRLRTNIAFARPGGVVRTVVFTSPLSGDGKTTTAANFALMLAGRGDRVLLIDADMRRGTVHTLFGAPREPGLSDVLRESCAFEDAVRSLDVGDRGQLEYLTSGAVTQEPTNLLDSEQMQALLDRVKTQYGFVVLDSPPLNVVSDAAVLGTSADGVVVVARAGVTALDALMYTMEQLHRVHAPILGAVLNDVDFRRDATYDATYRYYGHNDPYYAAPSE